MKKESFWTQIGVTSAMGRGQGLDGSGSGGGPGGGAGGGSLGVMYEWPHWEGIMHHVLLALILYALYVFYTQPSERKLCNVLLFTVVVAIDGLLHHFINRKNNQHTSYGL